ncbi:MAG: AAA-like domain-containing protein [Spirulina sp.]
MDVKTALDLVRQILDPQQLSYVEELVFVRTWQDQLYREMAIDTGYEEGYLKDIGSKLWQTLSQRLGYPVSKKRLRLILAEIANQSSGGAGVASGVNPIPLPTEMMDKSPEFPGSPLPFQSPWYVERPPLEEMASAALQQPGSLLRIKGAWGLGKTSLMNQILGRAQQQGMSVALVDMRQVDADALDSLDAFLRWFCWAISQKLNLNLKVDDYWFASAGSKLSCTTFIQDQVLGHLTSPVVIAIDTLHHLSEHPHIASNFLAMLRSWYEQARSGPEWGKLRLVLAYAAEFDLPLQTHQSPFNVGLPLDLPLFTPEQVDTLGQRYGLADIALSPGDIASLTARVGGHPYLIQLAFYWLQTGRWTVQRLVDQAATDDGIYREYLHRLWLIFQQSPALQEAWQQVINAKEPVALAAPIARRLEAMGLVQFEGGRAKVRCSLCRDYFAALYADC